MELLTSSRSDFPAEHHNMGYLMGPSSLRQCAAIMFAATGLAYSQAKVDETKETAFLYVDGATGSDINPGTLLSPLHTIGAAVTIAENNNLQSIGTKVTIA